MSKRKPRKGFIPEDEVEDEVDIADAGISIKTGRDIDGKCMSVNVRRIDSERAALEKLTEARSRVVDLRDLEFGAACVVLLPWQGMLLIEQDVNG